MMSIYLGDVIYQDDKFTATKWQGSYYMYWTKTIQGESAVVCGHLVSGESSFKSKYKSDFKKWIDSIQKREYSTMLSYLKQAEELIMKSEWMANMNDFDLTEARKKYNNLKGEHNDT